MPDNRNRTEVETSIEPVAQQFDRLGKRRAFDRLPYLGTRGIARFQERIRKPDFLDFASENALVRIEYGKP